jgi:hypothetical protein
MNKIYTKIFFIVYSIAVLPSPLPIRLQNHLPISTPTRLPTYCPYSPHQFASKKTVSSSQVFFFSSQFFPVFIRIAFCSASHSNHTPAVLLRSIIQTAYPTSLKPIFRVGPHSGPSWAFDAGQFAWPSRPFVFF